MTDENDDTPVAPEDDIVLDETEQDQTVAPVQYEITSYGADIDTEGFVNRLRRKDVYIPPFQRDYVWSQKEASRFIESLLLGLPVPGVFLAREHDSKRLLVIDGQQRLKTLEFFFDGFFNPTPDAIHKRVFDLQGVQGQFRGKTYEKLGLPSMTQSSTRRLSSRSHHRAISPPFTTYSSASIPAGGSCPRNRSASRYTMGSASTCCTA